MARESKRGAPKSEMQSLFGLIQAWIETESGPTSATFFIPKLKTRVAIRGYKKIILERDFERKVEGR